MAAGQDLLWNLHTSHVIRAVASKVGSKQTPILGKEHIRRRNLFLFVLSWPTFQELWLTAVIPSRALI